jgi:S-adenosylmethionine-diacylgycerolhomoserine-N-methlytransferase
MPSSNPAATQAQTMQKFYRWQASLYDATRWAFLFGRRRLLRVLPSCEKNQQLAEIGCGTGWNLRHLATLHPSWQLTGIDISPAMLKQARKATDKISERVQLVESAYGIEKSPLAAPVDLILFSYSLTMFNPGWEAAIEQAWADLKPGGHIAVVDFHDTPYTWFRKWMHTNHVRLDRHLLPFLESRFEPVVRQIGSGIGVSWRYFLFVGNKAGQD